MAEISQGKTFDATGHAHCGGGSASWLSGRYDDFIQMLAMRPRSPAFCATPTSPGVYEFARAHGEYFIAMEYVDGKDLRTILERCRQRRRPIPLSTAAYIASEIATGLHSAHVAVDPRGVRCASFTATCRRPT